MSSKENGGINRKRAEDVVKSLLQWLVVSCLGFAYWLAVLLLLSLFLNGVWHVAFEQLRTYSIVLAVITSVGYAIVMIRRKFAH